MTCRPTTRRPATRWPASRRAVFGALLLVAATAPAGAAANAQPFTGPPTGTQAAAGVFRGLGIAPALPGFDAGNPTAGLLSGVFGGFGGFGGGGPVLLTQPAAIADAVRGASCVALLNQVSGGGGFGSIQQSVAVERFTLNCR